MKINLRAIAKGPIEINLYDDISSDSSSGCTAQDVLMALAGKKDDVLVRINSAGGDVTEGLAIYSLLKGYPGKVTVRIDGLCASIATVIACGADEIEIAQSAFFMIHDPYTGGAAGGAKDLRSVADSLDKMTDTIVGIYADRTGMDSGKLAQLCSDETWMTAKEALEMGFVDTVIPGKKASIVASARKLTGFKNLPKKLMSLAAASSQKDKTMEEVDELKAALAALQSKYEDAIAELKKAQGKDDDEEAEDALPPPPKKKEEGDDGDDGDDDDDDKDAKARVIKAAKKLTGEKSLARLEGALMAAAAKLSTSSTSAHTAKVKAAIASGHLVPSMKAWALGTTSEAFSAYLESVGSPSVPVGKEFKADENKAKAKADENKASTKPETLTDDQKTIASFMAKDGNASSLIAKLQS